MNSFRIILLYWLHTTTEWRLYTDGGRRLSFGYDFEITVAMLSQQYVSSICCNAIVTICF